MTIQEVDPKKVASYTLTAGNKKSEWKDRFQLVFMCGKTLIFRMLFCEIVNKKNQIDELWMK